NVWIFPTYNVPYYLLHPLGLGILCQLNGVDSTKWSHSKVWYSGQLYNSIGEFKTAYNTNSNG
ncbi:amine oxidase, partial [Biomphalaria glabrata]